MAHLSLCIGLVVATVLPATVIYERRPRYSCPPNFPVTTFFSMSFSLMLVVSVPRKNRTRALFWVLSAENLLPNARRPLLGDPVCRCGAPTYQEPLH